VVDDFVSLPDLAPTILETAGVKVPQAMTGRSLRAQLEEPRGGQIDPQRTWVVTGRERHVAMAREGGLPYPQRAIRTRDFLFVVNFHPERWPLGDPRRLDGANTNTDEELTEEKLCNETFVTLSDEDAGPTKAWLVLNRDESAVRPFFDRAYGRRPREELYDLRRDPDQMKNVSDDVAYASVRDDLRERLFAELTRTNDPRMQDDGAYFEQPPLAGPLQSP
jgi:uncharacterized sulfatase